MGPSLFPGSEARVVALQSSWRERKKASKLKSLTPRNYFKMALNSKVNDASVACCLSRPTTPSPTTPEITIDWWHRAALVCTSALQSSLLTLFYCRNSARMRKMKRFKGSAGHFVSSSHSLISNRSAVKWDWELHSSWRCVLGRWRSSLKEQFGKKRTPLQPQLLLSITVYHNIIKHNK